MNPLTAYLVLMASLYAALFLGALGFALQRRLASVRTQHAPRIGADDQFWAAVRSELFHAGQSDSKGQHDHA